MRSLGAGRLRTFTLLEVPTALPYLLSGAKVLLQYTTTSARLHAILGVEHPGAS